MHPGLSELMTQWFTDNSINFGSDYSDPEGRTIFKPIFVENYNPSTGITLEFDGNVRGHFDDNTGCNIIELDPHSPDFFSKLVEFLICSCSSEAERGSLKARRHEFESRQERQT